MEITLQKITVDNYEEVGDLHVSEHQQDHLSSNIYSIAESMFNVSLHETRAIYNQGELIGFVMWVRQSDRLTSIW